METIDDTGTAQAVPAHPLAVIAATADTQASAEAQAGAPGQEAKAEAPSLPPEILAGMKLIPLACLRMLRTRIAKSTPEILAHWTDDVLDGPAAAVPPLLMRYAERWAPVLGANPELTLFAISCVPLGMGYIAASGEAEAKRAEVAKAQKEQGGAPVALAVVSGGLSGNPA